MFPPNGADHATTKIVLFTVILAMLAHLCSAQIAHGQQNPSGVVTTGEKFVPGTGRFSRGVSLEMRAEATLIGEEIRLRQIARWSDADSEILDPIGDLIIARMPANKGFRGISISEVKSLLRDAGVNISTLNFVGPLTCTVNRSDVAFDQGAALEQWAKAKSGAVYESKVRFAASPEKVPDVAIATPDTMPQAHAADSPFKSLKDLLEADLAQRLNIAREDLQMTFKKQDDKLLRLSEPHFKFDIQPQRVGNLGDVSWNVDIHTESGDNRVFIAAAARAWQVQVVAVKPLATKQVISDADVIDRRTLIDSLPSDPSLHRAQIVGQVAARDLRAGQIISSRLVEAVQMVTQGQFISINSTQGGINVRTVARAIDAGSYGQTVRVKNELTKEVYRVTVIGPQQASMQSITPTVVTGAVATVNQ